LSGRHGLRRALRSSSRRRMEVGARPRWYRRETERGWPGGAGPPTSLPSKKVRGARQRQRGRRVAKGRGVTGRIVGLLDLLRHSSPILTL
jgi:hypothetical protein